MRLLPPTTGLHETLLTRALKDEVAQLPDATRLTLAKLDPGDSHEALARHVYHLLRRTLHGKPDEQAEFCNRVLALTAEHLKAARPDDPIELPPQELREVLAVAGPGSGAKLVRPTTPLSTSALLTNAREEPSVGSELERELASADGVDLICAFVKVYGVRLIEEQIERLRDRGVPFRLLTTTYMAATERVALNRLASLGAEIRIAYEARTTRLHAKAWLFHRRTGFTTAYVGSSNLSKSALVDGLEWNVRLSQVETPHLIEKFRATFDTYWESPLFEPYDPERDQERFDQAMVAQRSRELNVDLTPFDLKPHQYQEEMLERLQAERERHNRWRSLVVAATGTGKTIVAAFDYRRLRRELGDLKLLFVAHRKEILEQSLVTFRHVLRDASFGELYVDGARPEYWDHVFASVQSLGTASEEMPPDHFDVVIIDEFHHAAAPTYRRLLERLQPTVLLGLTATPERTDGQSILAWFDGHIAVELRLWQALEEQLLCPFHYFGVADGTDLSRLEWRRGGYVATELENLYTADDLRVAKVLQALKDKLPDLVSMRAIGFCVSVAHARFMADRFTRAGVPALAVTGESSREERDDAKRRLSKREVNVLFTVDLYNEGVDIPRVDTLLLLRPTESATLFLQQLGRGLRPAHHKPLCTVLDFIGQQQRSFRFDVRYRALTGTSRKAVLDGIDTGFPYLPGGCHIQLDRVARKLVLDNIRRALPSDRRALVAELRQLAHQHNGDIDLPTFLRESTLELEDLYRSTYTWTSLRREAALPTAPEGPHEPDLRKGVQRLLHIDDPLRVKAYTRLLTAPTAPRVPSLSLHDRRLLTMLHFTLRGHSRKDWNDLQRSLDDLWRHPALLQEVRDLLALLDDRATTVTHDPDLPFLRGLLQVHARYTRDEILAAFDGLDVTKPGNLQAGVWWNEPTQTDVFFITLHKTERHFSPSTRYADYPLSPSLFHWQSQNATSPESKVGQRYVEHRERGTNVLLFVRERKKDERGMTMPYTFLGPADYVSHEGSKPISFTWRLRVAMPVAVFERGKAVGG